MWLNSRMLTERGVKHVLELMEAVSKGISAYVVFVVQMEGICCVTPNDETHREFGQVSKHIAQVLILLHMIAWLAMIRLN